jgi:hypothetical protein
MSNNRGLEPAPKKRIAMAEGPALPKETSGGGRKGSGKKPGPGGPELPKETSGKNKFSV